MLILFLKFCFEDSPPQKKIGLKSFVRDFGSDNLVTISNLIFILLLKTLNPTLWEYITEQEEVFE